MDELTLGVERPRRQWFTWFNLDAANSDDAY
jgi:hypothetical protein